MLRLLSLPCLLGAPAFGCCPSCAHPHVSFERKIVFRNTSSYFTCALFSSKRHCIENRKVLLRCSACCIKREVRGRPEQAACRAGIRRREEERARASSMQSRSDARSGVALRRRGPALVHGARQRAAAARHRQHGIGRRCLLWSAASFCTGLSRNSSFPCFPHLPA